eukprot:4620209-Pyramimonas_sp.AAC.1
MVIRIRGPTLTPTKDLCVQLARSPAIGLCRSPRLIMGQVGGIPLNSRGRAQSWPRKRGSLNRTGFPSRRVP